MSKASKSSSRVMISAVGVLAVFAIVVAINYIAHEVPASIDFTENKVHTLSAGTEKILAKLDTPVQMKLFLTGDDDVMPPQLKLQSEEIQAFLRQYVSKSDGMVTLQVYDPEPNTEEEDVARLAGLQPTPTRAGDVYFGLSITQLGEKATLPFLPGIPGELLEYEVTRAISQVSDADKPVVGVMSALEIAGSFGGMQFGQQGASPWVFYSELQRDFQVRMLADDIEAVEEDIDLVLLVHPGELSEQTQFALDQFVLRGGSLVAFLDPYSVTAVINQPQPNPLNPQQPPPQAPTSSTLPALLEAWGVVLSGNQIVADLNYKTPLASNQESPVLLTLPEDAINQEDVLTSKLSNLLYVYGGAFTGTPAEGLTREVLLQSSPSSQMIDPSQAWPPGEEAAIVTGFEASDERKALAIRLTGSFRTAFPDGKPSADAPAEEEPAAEDEEAEAGEEDEPAVDHLKKSPEGTVGRVVLVADSDIIADQFSVRVQRFFNQQLIAPINGNLAFFQNVMEGMAGDPALIEIRSRGSNRRPFTRINEIEEQAMNKIRDQLVKLEEKKAEAEQRLSELQAQKDETQKFVLTAEQQAEIERFQTAAVEASRERRALEKQAKADVDALINRIRALNLIVVPLAILLIGVVMAVTRRIRTSAR